MESHSLKRKASPNPDELVFCGTTFEDKNFGLVNQNDHS